MEMHFSDTWRVGPSARFSAQFVRPDRNLSQTLAQWTLIPLICASILAPFFSISPDLPAFRVEILMIPVILIVYGWLLLSGYVSLIEVNGMFLVGAAFCLCVLISTIYGTALLGQRLVPQDFYEFPKLFLPVAFFTIAYEANLSEKGLRRLLWTFGVCIVLICIYGWGQWLGLSFSERLNEFYTAGKHVDDALVYARRVYSTMGNPNVLGELLVWAIAAFLVVFLGKVISRGFTIFVLLAALITLSMTGSRYALLNMGLAVLLILFMPYANMHRRRQFTLLLMLVPVFLATIVVVAASNSKILERYQTLNNPLATDSATERFEGLWLDALDDFYKSPFLGRGPAKQIYADVITDSEYLGVMKQFGLIGLAAYLAYYVFPLILVWRGMRAGKLGGPPLETLLPCNYLLMRLGFVMIVTALVMNIGMSTFYNQLLQGFLWMWMGLSARAARNIRTASRIYPAYSLQLSPNR